MEMIPYIKLNPWSLDINIKFLSLIYINTNKTAKNMVANHHFSITVFKLQQFGCLLTESA